MNFEKRYYFKIDDEEIFFYRLMLDENKKHFPVDEKKAHGFENNPLILDVTDLGYIPRTGSIWDGKTFKLDGIDNINLETHKMRLTCTEYTNLAFLSNNVLFSCMSWCNNGPGSDAILAAAKSNPEIIYKEVEVE